MHWLVVIGKWVGIILLSCFALLMIVMVLVVLFDWYQNWGGCRGSERYWKQAEKDYEKRRQDQA